MSSQPSILVLGGGAIGLATAIELARKGAEVTILNRHPKSAALYAAAGMLAPEAEQIDDPTFFDLCLHSRELYPDWIQGLEKIGQLPSGYWPCGILAPKYEVPGSQIEDVPGSRRRFNQSGWLEPAAIHALAPYLSQDVIGGWRYDKDAQVNNRQLGHLLNIVANRVGVIIHHDITVNRLVADGHKIERVKTNKGDWTADHYLLATGAWSSVLGDIPVIPRKGQLLSVTPMDGMQPIELNQVLFGEEVYIVPRQTGEIVIGATSENVGFTPGNTVGGIHQLLSAAIRLVPQLQQYEIHEQWWGYRPTTPDELPILGDSPWHNLSIASGHYRNGILLTPITAKLLAQHILHGQTDLSLAPYRWDRFLGQDNHSEGKNAIACTP